MRYAIFSDIHANLEATEALIKGLGLEAVDFNICLGDLVGYGANPNQCIQQIRDFANITIAGNHDWAAIDKFSIEYFNDWAAQAILWTKRQLSPENICYLQSLGLIYENDDLICVHGSLDQPQEFNYIFDFDQARQTFLLMPKTLCFIGHSHSAGIFIQTKEGGIYYQHRTPLQLEQDSKYIINVGSVGQPRNGDKRVSFCIYDSQSKELILKRLDYDIATSQKKIISAGLPPMLAMRLSSGR
ncbi:MAG: metallophosphoesterase family protein [Candidatus Omnitrophica bacterium]|nr:metallophosphoesterase family protein [Candidatus Omnitrophota bacterium]